MSYSIPPTVATGDWWTASQQNSYLRENFLATFVGQTTDTGDMVYSTAANAVTPLGIGTAYDTLNVNSGATAPEWIAGARLLEISESTAGSTTDTLLAVIDFTNIPQDYTHLMVVGGGSKNESGIASTDPYDIEVRVNGTTDADSHAWQYIYGSSDTVTAVEGVTDENSIPVGRIGSGGTPYWSFRARINNYSATDNHNVISSFSSHQEIPVTGKDMFAGKSGGVYDVQEPITQLTFTINPGTTYFQNAKLTLYGLR